MMKHIQHANKISQRGAVSLFVVIFTALLITTVTISFMQLMTRDQQQAMYDDLSESAYDSAMAGVEDAKRVLLAHRDCGGSGTTSCDRIQEAIASEECNTVSMVIAGISGDETLVAQEEGDRSLEQAYTCVKISPNTEDYLGSFDSANTATLIPLRGLGQFDSIRVSWHQSERGGDVSLPADTKLPPATTVDGSDGDPIWPNDGPALLRAQLINGGGHASFHLSDFDDGGYSNTLFLMPSRTGIGEFSFAGDDGRRSGSAAPLTAKCQNPVPSGDYACEATLLTGSSIQSGRDVFLNLAAFYNPTDYKIELLNGSTPVPFRGVQPEVDSTGRANDLFRRVVSRVEIGNTFNYPVAALETSGNLCKNFHITNHTRDYNNNCEP